MEKVLCNNIPRIVSGQIKFVNESSSYSVLDEIKLAFNFEDNSISKKMETILKSRNIPIIGGSRLNKLEQSLFLEKHNITHPKTYYDLNNMEPFTDIETFDSYCNEVEFVVKPLRGARGIGVKKLNRVEYKKCLENPKKEVSSIFEKEIEIMRANDDVPYGYIEDSFNSGMLVQEQIYVESEFRAILFKPKEHLIYERVKESGQFIGNLTHGSKPRKLSEEQFNQLLPTINQLHNLMDELNYPWMSVDLYIDINGNVGVFEYQMEFAYEGFNPSDIKEKMVNSIKHYINKI
jgi:hypothetical protein